MKTNPTLHEFIGFQNPSEKCWYAAHVLMAALTASPAIPLVAAVPAVAAKPAVIAQTAKPARAASLAVTGANNTTGYAFGELYLNSPAYPIGTPIPAIPGKPASNAVVGVPAVVAVPATTAVIAPAVVPLKGYENSIDIKISSSALTITADLPYYANVGIVASQKLVIGEITPAALMASAYLDERASTSGQQASCVDNLSDLTLEQAFYRMAKLCNYVETDIVKAVNGVNMNFKRLVVILYPSGQFDRQSDALQLAYVRIVPTTGS